MNKLTKKLWKPFANTSRKQQKQPEERPASPSPQPDIQVVRVNGIDPEKLVEKLNLKFASDSGPKFKIHVSVHLDRGVVALR